MRKKRLGGHADPGSPSKGPARRHAHTRRSRPTLLCCIIVVLVVFVVFLQTKLLYCSGNVEQLQTQMASSQQQMQSYSAHSKDKSLDADSTEMLGKKSASAARKDGGRMEWEANMRSRVARAKAPPAELEGETEDDADIHFVVSTDCKYYQNWQMVALLHSARVVGQKGTFTRIVSGCEKHKVWKEDAIKSMKPFPNAKLHFTPDFSVLKGDEYPPYNRPHGFQHWLDHVDVKERVIVVIDPDMLFFKPFVQHGSPAKDLVYTVNQPGNKLSKLKLEAPTDRVEEGRPVGQFYGIGASYVLPPYKLSDFCDPGTECLKTSTSDAWDFYAVGPPYMLHRNDFKKMVPLWLNFTYKSRQVKPVLIAEMFAYSLAAAHYGLKHVRLDNFMLSDPGSNYGEAFAKLDYEADDPCKVGRTLDASEGFTPNFIHMAHRYGFMFHKRHVPWDILECDAKMLQYPPHDLLEKAIATGKESEKRGAWLACNIIPIINAALIHYKDVNCKPGYNTDQTSYVMHPPSVAYGRPVDACEKCVKKVDGGAYAATQLVDNPGAKDQNVKWDDGKGKDDTTSGKASSLRGRGKRKRKQERRKRARGLSNSSEWEANMRSRVARAKAPPAELEGETEDDADIHFVVSTDCKYYQNWQMVALLHSARVVGQKGTFTRIVSGCEKHKVWKEDAIKSMKPFPNAKLHFTPDFSVLKGDEYPPYNRPHGFQHWLDHVDVKERVIVVIDPDMLFFKPFVQHGSPAKDLVYTVNQPGNKLSKLKLEAPTDRVEEGRPVGQFYGIGASYVLPPYKLSDFCDPGTECLKTSTSDAWDFYAVGPPYMLHRNDFKKMVPLWLNFTYKSRQVKPVLIAEMFAYSLAAAHYGLKHVRLDNFMLSDPGSNYGEAFAKLDYEADDPCKVGRTLDASEGFTPNFIHMAHRYGFMFHKRHVPWDILECDAKMLQYPPHDLLEKAIATGKESEKRGAWLACNIIPIINAALIHYKDVNCKPGYNTDQTSYVMHPPSVAYGRPVDACEKCVKKVDGGAYAATQLVDN